MAAVGWQWEYGSSRSQMSKRLIWWKVVIATHGHFQHRNCHCVVDLESVSGNSWSRWGFQSLAAEIKALLHHAGFLWGRGTYPVWAGPLGNGRSCVAAWRTTVKTVRQFPTRNLILLYFVIYLMMLYVERAVLNTITFSMFTYRQSFLLTLYLKIM